MQKILNYTIGKKIFETQSELINNQDCGKMRLKNSLTQNLNNDNSFSIQNRVGIISIFGLLLRILESAFIRKKIELKYQWK